MAPWLGLRTAFLEKLVAPSGMTSIFCATETDTGDKIAGATKFFMESL